MALDLAGFTSLTERLSALGTRGTEELSRVLRGYFASVTDVVCLGGGDPVAFGGDSLSVVFDGPRGPTLGAALDAAAKVQELTTATTATRTLAGPLGVEVRIGIAHGTVATAVARSRRRLLPVHVGPGLDLAHAAQEGAAAGAVVVHDSARPGRREVVPDQQVVRVRSLPSATGGRESSVDLSMLLSPVLLERLRRRRALVETHRVVTVAFVRFPPVQPHALRPFLDQVVSLMDLADVFGGEVIQVSGGDKGVLAMVVFGAPTVHADDPVRAVHAMLELRRREPRAAVGIATGPVFAAVLGSRSRMFATHSGPAVNVAARLSQLALPGRILATDRTWAESSQRLRQAGPPQRRSLKGCAGPVTIHEVAGWRHAAPRPDSSALPLLVGRVAELERLEQLLNATGTGHGGALAFVGEPGIGKTRVVQEAVERARTRGFSVSYADVADHPRGHPVGAWRDVVGSLLGVRRKAPRRAWLDALTGALPDVPGHLAVLAPLLELRTTASSHLLSTDIGPLAPELAQATMSRLLRTGTRGRPALLVVENADRLDEVSLGVLRALAIAARDCAAGLLVTLGQDRSRGVEALLAEVPPVVLRPLARADTELLVGEAWRQSGGGSPPAWLAPAVVARCGGNPLLARVVTRALLSRWKPGDPRPADHVVTGAVGSLLLGHVDRLPPDARELLTVLAVVQRPCDPVLLLQVLPGANDWRAIRRSAARLVSEGLVLQSDDGPTETYALAHEMLRQVVYDATSHAERERLHRRLVTGLGGRTADPVEVAHHVEPLGDHELARRWFPLAARAARDSWNLVEAVRWLERLQPLLDGRARALVELDLLEMLLVAGRASEVLERVDRPQRDEPSELDVDAVIWTDPVLEARRLHVLAEATYSCGQLDRAETVASRVMRLTDGVDEGRYMRAAELLTLSRCHHGKVDGALQSGQALVSRAARTADPAAQSHARSALAVALVLSGQPAAATEHYQAALVAAEATGDVVRQVHVLSDLAGCAHLTGRHASCVELLAKARHRADAIGYRRHLALNLNNEAQLRASLGDPFATSCAAAAVERSVELGDLPTAADALHTWLTAKPSLAADPVLWRRLVEVDLELDRSLEAAAGWAELAVVLARAGRRDAALDAGRQAERSAPDSGLVRLRRRARFAALLAERHHVPRPAPDVQARIAEGLRRLAQEADLDECEAAEVALERWRVSRAPVDRTAAIRLAHRAFAVEPSALVRSWLRLLRQPLPPAPETLPAPVGISRRSSTRRDLAEALARVEAALRSR